MKISLDIQKSAQENADFYYKKAKKAKKKISGVEKALQETIRKIEELKKGKLNEEEVILKKRTSFVEKKWYEKFRYFFSSDNFLVIGGKDATSNEVIIKKYLEKNDLVFHADIQGAPFFVIKNTEKREIPNNTKLETAEVAASYSKAWSFGFGNCDVYSVRPEQISKKAPSGEYLSKGSFMIYGKKEWFKKVELKLAIGVSIKEDKIKVYGGPINSIELRCKYFAIIKPGNKKSKELAQEIKKFILRKANKEDGKKIKEEINLDEFQRWIPSGRGMLISN